MHNYVYTYVAVHSYSVIVRLYIRQPILTHLHLKYVTQFAKTLCMIKLYFEKYVQFLNIQDTSFLIPHATDVGFTAYVSRVVLYYK